MLHKVWIVAAKAYHRIGTSSHPIGRPAPNPQKSGVHAANMIIPAHSDTQFSPSKMAGSQSWGRRGWVGRFDYYATLSALTLSALAQHTLRVM